MTPLALLIAALMPLTAPQQQSAPPSSSPVFVPEHGGVVAFLEPALVRTLNGTLIAVAEAHQDDAREAPWHVDLALRTSTDDGRTWSDMRLLREFEYEDSATRPSLLVDPASGRVFLFYNYGPFRVDWESSAPGSRAVGDGWTLRVQEMHSDDDGATWSAPRELNPMIKNPAWEAISVSSASGIATSDGRLIQPVFVRAANTGIGARNISSDDGGVTWTIGPRIGEETMESCVIELAGGGLLQNMTPVPYVVPRVNPQRRPTPLKFRLLARSQDGHKFGDLEDEQRLPDANFDATMLRRGPVEGDPRDLVLFTNSGSLSARERLTLRWSENACVTWAGKLVLDAGPSGASALALLDGHELGVLFERGDRHHREQIAFTRVDFDQLPSDPTLLDAAGRLSAAHPDLWAWYEAHGAQVSDTAAGRIAHLVDRSTAERHDLAGVSLGTGALLPGVVDESSALGFTGRLAPSGSSPASSGFGSLSGPLTITLVARVRDLETPIYLLDGTGDGRLALRTRPSTRDLASWELRLHTGDHDLVSATGLVIPEAFGVHSIVLRRKAIHHYIDGRLAGTLELPAELKTVHLDGLILGTDGDAAAEAACEIAELQVYSTALPGPARKSLETYLKLKHGL